MLTPLNNSFEKKKQEKITRVIMHTCFDARTAILYLGSRAGTLTTDLIALNVCESFRKSSSICTRGHLTGSKTKSLQLSTQVNAAAVIVSIYPFKLQIN